ncbi:DUF6179 domain-containing protein [Enterococcus sp. BWR-S5]|uniref:DUF6179 domain-containing protein n=1 Tax=Enterococcus sp. BWR-S5 TaxID=2787714 RepID=UPI001921671C|nr:DUF6179 domain-containing protein [Enterococcus sp. BWR-S5]MBL1225187.1 hypothetical protein [Enterococcus sp. BWR-S5]
MEELTTQFDRNEILFLLKRLMAEKMSGTTSMPIDEGENLLQSILYTLTYAETDEVMGKISVSERFKQGKQAIKKQLKQTTELYKQVLKTNNQLPIDSYQNLLRDFADFFTSYDIDYAAHQTGSLWIDYQLAFPIDDQRTKGVDFVSAYLESLFYENLFCTCFSKQQLLELFEAYGKQLQMDYRRDINNIYDRVFFQAIGRLLTGARKSSSLLLTETDFQQLQKIVEQQTESQIRQAFTQLLSALRLPNHIYYHKTFQLFYDRMTKEATKDMRQTFFIFQQPTVSLFLVNEGMLAADFSAVVTSIERVQSKEKIELLLKNFLSIYDYLDFFELELLNDKEYELLFAQLGIEMLAVFIKFIEREEREEAAEVEAFVHQFFEANWKQQLQSYLKSLPNDAVRELNNYLRGIELPPLDFQ